MKLELKKFNMKELNDDSVIVALGKRRTGKSWLVRDIMYRHRDMPVGIVISPTESSNHFFEKFIPGMLVHDEYTPDTIKKFLDRQEKIMNRQTKEIRKYGSSDIDPRAFLILDDCMYKKEWVSDESIRFLFCNGRHRKVLFIITQQFPLGIPPVLRTNVDFIFIYRENIVSNRKRIYENYAGMFSSFDVFCSVLDQTTENYECLVINNKTQSNKLTDQVFWYKAESHDDFHVGHQEFWDLQALEDERKLMREDVEEDDEEDEYNPRVFQKKKNSPVINVRKGK